MFKIESLTLCVGSLIVAATCNAGEPVGSKAVKDKLETFYLNAYDCYERDEYVCASFNFSKLLQYEHSIPIADARRIKVDFAYSLFLTDTVPGMDEMGHFIDKQRRLEAAKDALLQAGYQYSYINTVITMELAEHLGLCHDDTFELLGEVAADLENQSSFVDAADWTELETGAVRAKAEIFLNRNKQCSEL